MEVTGPLEVVRTEEGSILVHGDGMTESDVLLLAEQLELKDGQEVLISPTLIIFPPQETKT